MEVGSIWLEGFRLGVLDCPPGTAEPKAFTKPTAALFTSAMRTKRGDGWRRGRKSPQRISVCSETRPLGYRTQPFNDDCVIELLTLLVPLISSVFQRQANRAVVSRAVLPMRDDLSG